MRTLVLFLATAAVLLFAPWQSGPPHFAIACVLFAVLALLTIASHMTDVVRPDAEDMDRKRRHREIYPPND